MTTTTNLTATSTDQHRLLTLHEAAAQLRVSVDSVLRSANRGDLATIRIGRRRLIAPEDLDAFVARQREEHNPHGW